MNGTNNRTVAEPLFFQGLYHSAFFTFQILRFLALCKICGGIEVFHSV